MIERGICQTITSDLQNRTRDLPKETRDLQSLYNEEFTVKLQEMYYGRNITSDLHKNDHLKGFI